MREGDGGRVGHGGMPLWGMLEESVCDRHEIPRLRFAALGMTCGGWDDVGGMDPRMREENGGGGDGFLSASSRGQALRGNDGRERGFHCGMTGDTGRGGSRTAPTGEGAGTWGQSIFIAITGEGAHEGRPYGGWGRFESGSVDVGNEGDGSPHARGQRRGRGWVTSASSRGAGSPWEQRGGVIVE